MRLRYIVVAIVWLFSGLAAGDAPSESVLFIGNPCACMDCVRADRCDDPEALPELLAAREYRWVVVFEPVEDRQALAGYLLRTQPQADVILMADESLAGKYRFYYAPDCCTVLEILKKDG